MQLRKLKSIKIITAILFVASIAISVILPVSSAKALVAPNTSARISFTFDDGYSSALLAADTLKSYGYTGTEYIITSCVGMTEEDTCDDETGKTYMTWTEIVELQNTYGWEIGSHSTTHPFLSEITDTIALDNEMSQSQSVLNSYGLSALSFAAPSGDYNNNVLAAAAKYYTSFRTFKDLTFDTNTANIFPYFYPHSIYPYNNYLLTVLSVQGDVPVATVQSYIDQAISNNQWLILVFHDIKADTDTTYDPSLDAYQYTAGSLGQIAAYVQSKSLRVVNINDGLARGTNIMPNSGFNNGIADGWTVDDAGIVADQQLTTLAGHGSFDSTADGAKNSVHITNATVVNTHLFSPLIDIAQGVTYTIKSFVNILSTAGSIDFYIDEYDANGVDLGTGKIIRGISGETTLNHVQVGSMNFLYTPISPVAVKARLQVISTPGTDAYVDNLEWLSPTVNGDVNGDGLVNLLDLNVVLSHWNLLGQTADVGELNNDGVVNLLDLNIILSNWGK